MILLLLLQFSLYAQGPFVLTEDSLLKHLENKISSIEKIKANQLQNDLEYLKTQEYFSPRLELSSDYLKSDERSFISFIPAAKKGLSHKLSVIKPTSYGAEFFANIYTNQATNSLLTNSTTTGIAAGVGLDLYKDFLGRSSRATLERQEIKSKRSKLEKEIQIQTFVTQIKKLYWALVANEESLKIASQLLNSSLEQLEYGKKRYRNGIADKGEIARYEAQVAQRKSQIISFKYERSGMIRTLKENLNSLSDKEIILGDYSVEKTIESVLICSDLISKYDSAPLNLGLYDEISKLLMEEQKLDTKVTNLYSSAEVKLKASIDTMGKAFSTSDSIDDWNNDRRRTIGVGLFVSIPFGGSKSNTKDKITQIQKHHYLSQLLDNQSKMNAFHHQTLESIAYLKEVIKSQRKNTGFLKQSLSVSQKKYAQARIAVEQLVQEQDLLLRSNLDEIQSDLAVIHTLLEYFSVFGKISCQLNRNI